MCTEEAADNIMTALRVHQINEADGKFSHALHRLRHRRYTVILVVPSRVGVSSALRTVGMPPLESSGGQLPLDEIELESLYYMQRKRKPCEIPISREPSYSPIDLMDSQGRHDIISCLFGTYVARNKTCFHVLKYRYRTIINVSILLR
nr:hypothetical protein [Tanacetum cinerariifolium]